MYKMRYLPTGLPGGCGKSGVEMIYPCHKILFVLTEIKCFPSIV